MTAYRPMTMPGVAMPGVSMPVYDASVRPRAGTRGYLILAGLAMATGSVVLVEPAPYDLAIILLFCAGVLLRRLSFTREHRLPVLLLAGFFCANAISMC